MLKDLYKKASRLQSAEHSAKEVDKLNTLRGGTTGHLNVATGVVSGQCHRLAMLRYLGLSKEAESNLYFDMGHANESLWETKLKKSYTDIIRFEGTADAIKTDWVVGGVHVTGSPDIVLCDAMGEPVAGVELKAMGAINSASDVLFGNAPKLENLLQTAHYSKQVGVPFYLVYTALVGGDLPYYKQKEFGAKKIAPFIKEFKVELDEAGQISYTPEEGSTVRTPFSFEGIKSFYELVVAMAKEKSLYSRYVNSGLDGGQPKWDPCKYCYLNEICDKYEGDYDRWMDEASRKKETLG